MEELHLSPHAAWLKDFSLNQSVLAVMYHGMRFRITVTLDALSFNDALEEKYIELVETIKADDDDSAAAESELCELLARPVYPLMRDLAPKVKPEDAPLTMQQFYFPPTTFVELALDDTQTKIIAHHQPPPELPDSTGFFLFSNDLPPFPKTPRIKASRVVIVTKDQPIEEFVTDIPSEVRVLPSNFKDDVNGEDGVMDSSTSRYFKPCLDADPFIREVTTLSRVRALGLDTRLRIPRMRGIVESDDGSMVIGLILDMIPSDRRSLNSEECLEDVAHHAQWETQVLDIVRELHAHDIVWGDAQPGNVIIDRSMNCWLVDFQGGHLERFVDREKARTKEGDLQGIKRIFKEWLTDTPEMFQRH